MRVWDLPTRLFHWTLVALVALLWVSGEFGGLDLTLSLPGKRVLYLSNMDVHALAGQGVFVLLVFRLLWGLWGSTTARFAHFVSGPRAVWAELRALLAGRVPDAVGHNPLGALSILAMLALLAVQVGTGLFARDDFFFEGPLAHRVTEETSERLTGLHHENFEILQALILLHVGAVLYYWARGRNLVVPMITGRKVDLPPQAAAQIRLASPWRALVTLALAMGALAAIRTL